MDSQIESAIEIAWNPASDQNLKLQAFDFLNQLKSDASGFLACTNLFTRIPKASEVVRVVSLDVVNHALQTQQVDPSSQRLLREKLFAYIRQTYTATSSLDQVDQASLQNKLTQTLTYLFVFSYEFEWQSFLGDFLALTRSSNTSQPDNLVGTSLYLRVLISIHDEIGDVLLSRSGDEQKRSTNLKDLVRARDVDKVANSWNEILVYWKDRNDAILEMCLKVIGRWVSWIDISLVVNDMKLDIVRQLVASPATTTSTNKVRYAAIDCFIEILAKKMKATEKIGLMVFLDIANFATQLSGSPAMTDLRSTPDYDVDLAERISKLVNNTINDTVKALEDSSIDNSARAAADQLLQTFVPLLLRFLSDDYDEVCSAVIPSLTDLLVLFRKAQPLPPHYAIMLKPTLNAIIAKMRYDETATWGDEDEQTDEAEFQELRKRLQILQKSISAIDQSLYIEVLSGLVEFTFQNYDQQKNRMNWRDLDLALHEMYLFGELALPNTGPTKVQPSPVAAERLVVMMQKMISSDIASFGHPAIQLQYMEICVRYHSVFESQVQMIQPVLDAFLTFVHHKHVRVQRRSWYLFSRFIKHLRAVLGAAAEKVISSMRDLLPVKAELPKEDSNEDMSSEDNSDSADATFTSQLYLFETVGCIASTQSTPIAEQRLLARSVMDPLFVDLEQTLPSAVKGDALSILQVHHIIMALGILAHGFSDWTPGKSSRTPAEDLAEEFNRVTEAVLIALESLGASFEVRTASRAAFSRLIGVMGARILPQLPRWIEGLLSAKSSKEEMAMFLRVLEQVVFGFKGEIYDILDSLLSPLLQRLFAGLSETATGTDDEIQLGELRREYLSFIQIILNNDLGAVLISASNQGVFESLISSVTRLALNVTPGAGDLIASRLAFSVLTRMASLWGGPDVATPSANPVSPTPSPSPAIPGFDNFFIERFNPVCWEVLRETQFRPSGDAQAKQVLNEIAGLQQTIYCKTGDVFIHHLRNSFFPAFGFDGTDFIRAMTTSTDRKAFAGFIQAFLKQRA